MSHTEEKCDQNKFKKNARKIKLKNFRGESLKKYKKIMIKDDIKKRIYFL